MANKDSLPDIRVGLQFRCDGDFIHAFTIYKIEGNKVWVNWEEDREGLSYDYQEIVNRLKEGVWKEEKNNPIPEKWCVLQDRKEVNDWFNQYSQINFKSYFSTEAKQYMHYPVTKNTHQHSSIQEHYKLITYEQFQAITNQMNKKKIIGYKIKKQYPGLSRNNVGVVLLEDNNFKLPGGEMVGGKIFEEDSEFYNPDFIREYFEPIYKDEEKVLKLGDKNIEVKIGKGYIQADGKEFNHDHLEELFQSLTSISTLNGYSVEVTGVKVGCTEFKPVELNEILNAYRTLNDEK